MSSLREIKDRIGSVKSTLKITSAMKLVASSKLRKAQRAIENLRPYERELDSILVTLKSGGASAPEDLLRVIAGVDEPSDIVTPIRSTAVVLISSNSSLCGGFNSNVIRKAAEVLKDMEGPVKVFALGRKAADAMKKAGFAQEADYTDLIAHPSYGKVSALAGSISKRYLDGEFSRVVLVYNHFVSTSKQVPVAEVYLPFVSSPAGDGCPVRLEDASDFIVEPSAEEVVETLMPQVLMLKFYAAVLDSAAAEHAARAIAMQTATDNAEELLGDLTLEYNKGRQQKITAEILDLIGGTAE